jgi:GxxExxY protein
MGWTALTRPWRHLDDESILLDPETESIVDRVLRVVREVYVELGPGLSEAIYQEAMEIALSEAQVPFVPKPALVVAFRGRQLLRRAFPDLIVANRVVVELKAAESIHPVHETQLLTYLRITGHPVGSGINFHAPTLSTGIRRRVLTKS